MRTYKCKAPDCGYSAEGNSPSVLIPHARDVHGRTNRGARGGRRRRNATAELAAAVVDVDKESNLLAQCTTLFLNAGTDREADQRVLEYLAARFGPAAYADETDADDAGDETETEE